jgi:hypothetical protein
MACSLLFAWHVCTHTWDERRHLPCCTSPAFTSPPQLPLVAPSPTIHFSTYRPAYAMVTPATHLHHCFGCVRCQVFFRTDIKMLGVLQDRCLHICKYRHLRCHVSKYVRCTVGKYRLAYMTSHTFRTTRHFRVSSDEHRVSTLRVLDLVP